MSATALHLEGVHKRFGDVRALDDAGLEVRRGEVHALLGQNGSGKSTLIKVLTGYHVPDRIGRATLWDRPLDLPLDVPARHGLAVIHQDLALAEAMTVTENLGVSTGFDRRTLAPVSWRDQRRRTRQLLDEFAVALDPDARIAALRPAERAAVAMLRAIRELRASRSGGLLVLDEPTASMPADDATKVMRLMRSVAASGSAVIFVSHRLGEVMSVCDRATILRDGRTVETVDVTATTPRALIKAMLGRDLGAFYPDKRPHMGGTPLLRVRGLAGGVLRPLDIDAGPGEIVGVTGLAGQGHEELPSLLSGAARSTDGTVSVADRVCGPGPRERMRAGLVMVPGDRKRDGVWLEASAAENISLPVLRRHVSRGVLRPTRERSQANKMMRQLDVRPLDPERALSGFSGGNQQKIVMAKWLQTQPQVLVLDESSQGVDAAGRREILRLVTDVVADGACALVCSSDFEEIAHLCHRVIVLQEGRVVASLDGDDVTEQAILEACHAEARVSA